MKINTDRVMIVGDLHYGEDRNSSHALKLNNECMEDIIKQGKELGVDTIIQLGDVFHSRSALDVKIMNGAYDMIKTLANNFENVIICVGNHDIYYKDDTKVNSLKVFGEIANVSIIETTEELEFKSGKVGLLTAWNADLNSIDKTYDYMFGHFEPNGAMYSGAVAKGYKYGLSDLTKVAPMVFSGHFHIAKDYPTKHGVVKMVGSIREFNYGDMLNPKRCIVLDADSEEQSQIINTSSPRHVKLYWSKCKKKSYKVDTDEIRNNRVQLVIDCKYNYEEIIEFTKLLNKENPIKVEPDYIFSATKDLLADAKKLSKTSVQLSNLEYINKFIDEMDSERGFIDGADRERLKAMVFEYYTSSMENIAQALSTDVTFNNIEIQNFKSVGYPMTFDYNTHKNLNFIYGVNLDIEGSRNGVGKSVIFIESPLFAIYGKTLENTPNKFLPNRVMQSTKLDSEVNLDFNVNGKRYRVNNTIKSGRSTIGVELLEYKGETDGVIEWKDLSKSTTRETRKFIANEIIGCSYELAKSTIALSSSSDTNFLKMKKADKRQHISDVFKLQVFTDMLTMIRDARKVAHVDVLDTQKKIKESTGLLDTYTNEDVKFNKKIQGDIANRRIDIKIMQSNIDAISNELSDGEIQLLASIEELPTVQAEQKQVQSKLNEVTNSLQELWKSKHSIQSRRDESALSYDRFKTSLVEAKQKTSRDTIDLTIKALVEYTDARVITKEQLNTIQLVEVVPINEGIKELDLTINELKYNNALLSSTVKLNASKVESREKEIAKFNGLLKVLCGTCVPMSESLYGLDVMYKEIEQYKENTTATNICIGGGLSSITSLVGQRDELLTALGEYTKTNRTYNDLVEKQRQQESKIEQYTALRDVEQKAIDSNQSSADQIVEQMSAIDLNIAKLDIELGEATSEYYTQQKVVDGKTEELGKINSKIDTLMNAVQVAQTINTRINRNNTNKMQFNETITRLLGEIKELKNTTSQFTKLVSDTQVNIAKMTMEMSDRVTERELLKILEVVCDEKGAKSYIMIDLIEIMNNLIRKYLEKMGSKYTVMFDATFEALFLTSTGECDYSSFSCGERQRIDIATLFAFNDILHDGGIRSNIKVIDELLDSGVDAYCIDALIKILHQQSLEQNQTMYIISHREEIATNPLIDNVIEVTKHNEVSSITRDEQGGVK